MNKHFDVIVLGLGANGSSAIYHLSKTSAKVCGIDQFTPPHTHGSSHGQSRIIRQAYYESPFYVPLLKEAYTIWHEVEKLSGKKLFLKTGGLMLGAENSAVVKGSKLSADMHGIAYEYLDNNSIEKRFPAFRPAADIVGVLEKEAGILFPEECIQTFLQQAQKNGASLCYDERVVRIIPSGNTVEIITDKSRYTTSELIVSAGAWLNELMPDLHLPLSINRQVLFWMKNSDEKLQQYFAPAAMPVYIWEYEPGKMFYGFPDLGDGIKIARHHEGLPVIPAELTTEVSEDEIKDIELITRQYLNIDAAFNYSATCMYTNTPDENFIIDHHPQHRNIIIASPCSGHGFKFSSITGKILSSMATNNSFENDISMFKISRFVKD